MPENNPETTVETTAAEITDPFIFKDALNRVYRAEPRDGKWWLQSWNQAGGGWNDVHEINAEEVKAFSARQLSPEEAAPYAPKIIEPAGDDAVEHPLDQPEKGENPA